MQQAIHLSALLEAALLAASIAFIALVGCLIPLAFRAQRQLEQLVSAAGQLKGDLDVLVRESHELLQNLNNLVTRANDRWQNIEEVVRTAGQWKNLFRGGATLVQAFVNRNRRTRKNEI